MKTSIKKYGLVFGLLALCLPVLAQYPTNVYLQTFDIGDSVTNNTPTNSLWAEWFGSATTIAWDSAKDAGNNPNSGSVSVSTILPGASQQYVVMNNPGNFSRNGFIPVLNGSVPFDAFNNLKITNFQCDVMFDPTSSTNNLGAYGGELSFGSRGTGFAQPTFGTVYITNAGWHHVSLPIDSDVQPVFSTMPNLLVKLDTFDGRSVTINGQDGHSTLWVDNIQFVAAVVPNPPPKMKIQPATPKGLWIFAGSTATVNDREELQTVSQNLSWIGGAGFPVSYSFTVLRTPNDLNIGQTHMMLLPTAFQTAPGYNGTDYTSSNLLWLVIAPRANGGCTAQIAWKTNAPASNPANLALLITNSTRVGTWTVTFSNDSGGTLTAPGASPAAFTIADPNVDTDFANPMIGFFGLQPNTAAGEGEYEVWGNIGWINTADGGFSEDFTAEGTISGNFNNFSAVSSSLVVVDPAITPLWVNWSTPDAGYDLGTSTSLTNSADHWFTPGYWSSDFAVKSLYGSRRWVLLNNDQLPTVDGNQFSAPGPIGFFRLSNPPPAQ